MTSALLYALLIMPLILMGCGKTATVIKDSDSLPDPPKDRPTEPIPDVKNPGGTTLENDEVEQYALNDALRLNAADALNTVYLSAANFVNFKDDTKTALKGTELGLNLLSNRNFIEKVRSVDPEGSIWAVDLRDFWGSKALANWRLVEDRAVIKIVSRTVRFQNLQFLTQKRIPIMHAQIFLETAFQAPVYYLIKDVPQNENDFWAQQGIDRQRQFDDRDRDIFLAGFQNSLIAPDHNRMTRRMRGNNGTCWNTYDVDALAVVPESNYFQFPFVAEARSARTLKHAAGEIICRSQSGLLIFALYNGAGVRQNLAPTTVVVNTRTSALGLDPSITIRDCTGCHTQFVLPVRDEVGRQIQSAPFNASDKLLGQIFFKPQTELEKMIAQDNSDYAAALNQLSIFSGGNADPINVGVIDKMRDGMDARELAAFLYIDPNDFIECLRGSQSASQEVGQLLSGGTIGFISLQASVQTIINDCLLFQDRN